MVVNVYIITNIIFFFYYNSFLFVACLEWVSEDGARRRSMNATLKQRSLIFFFFFFVLTFFGFGCFAVKTVVNGHEPVRLDRVSGYLSRLRTVLDPGLKSLHCFQQLLRHVYCWYPVPRKRFVGPGGEERLGPGRTSAGPGSENFITVMLVISNFISCF